jgi:hypothetical protein
MIGLALAVAIVVLGGKVKYSPSALEVTFRPGKAQCGKLARMLPFHAITLGHVILAVTEQDLDCLRAHELVHVQQYERWGVAFFVVYAASSIWQLLKGREAYWDNYFEVQARLRSTKPAAKGRGA